MAAAPEPEFGLRLPVCAGVAGCFLVAASFTRLFSDGPELREPPHPVIQNFPLALLALFYGQNRELESDLNAGCTTV